MHIHHIIILLVYNFLAIMNKTTKIQKDVQCDICYKTFVWVYLSRTKNENGHPPTPSDQLIDKCCLSLSGQRAMKLESVELED
jgi:hypothetical protein